MAQQERKGREWVLLAKHYESDADFRAAVENALVDIFAISYWGGRGVCVAPLRVKDEATGTYVTVGFAFEEVWMPALKSPEPESVDEPDLDALEVPEPVEA